MVSGEIPESAGADPVLLSLYKTVEERAGIRAGPEQLEKLRKRLESRVPSHDPAAYREILENREELAACAPLFTVNETYFFREGLHFHVLFRRLLPLLTRRPIRICSAATSSGCEAYSIAMTLDFYCRHRLILSGESPSWELDAFDLNPQMIDAARRGRYRPNALREDGSEWKTLMDLYLRPGAEGFSVAGFLREKVRFFVHNVIDGFQGSYDVIFFRNALIYFSPENRRKILGILFNALRVGGVLIVGISETSLVEGPDFRMLHHGGIFYFTKEAPPPAAVAAVAEGAEGAAVAEGAKDAALSTGSMAAAESGRPVPARGRPAAAPVPPGGTMPGEPKPRLPPAEFREGGAIPEITLILERDEGRSNAARVLKALEAKEGKLDFAGLAAAALSLMNTGDLSAAALVISSLEEMGSSPLVSFLRGELYYQGADFSGAEAKYQEAAAAESGFWPALYRAASLAEGGNVTRYHYRLKKALEGMEKGAGRGYEVFIGGFSPDYYRRILEKKVPQAPNGPRD